MIIDKTLQVSTAQAFTATAASTDVVDLTSVRDVGAGEPLYMVAVAKTAMTGTSPTLSLAIETDDNSARSSPVALATSRSYTALAIGDRIVLPLPPGAPYERYLGVRATLGGTSPAVTLDIFFTNHEPALLKMYQNAI